MKKEKTKTQFEEQFLLEMQHKDKESQQELIEEIGGAEGPEPTRYGDWEKKGRCIDF